MYPGKYTIVASACYFENGYLAFSIIIHLKNTHGRSILWLGKIGILSIVYRTNSLAKALRNILLFLPAMRIAPYIAIRWGQSGITQRNVAQSWYTPMQSGGSIYELHNSSFN